MTKIPVKCIAELVLKALLVCNRVGLRWKVVGDMTGWLGSSVVECSHVQRKALGSSAGRTSIFHLLHVDTLSNLLMAHDWDSQATHMSIVNECVLNLT